MAGGAKVDCYRKLVILCSKNFYDILATISRNVIEINAKKSSMRAILEFLEVWKWPCVSSPPGTKNSSLEIRLAGFQEASANCIGLKKEMASNRAKTSFNETF